MTGLPRFSIPTCQLGAGGEQRGAGVFIYRSHKETVAGDGGCCQLGYLASNSG
jgi:hypothetical protein